MSRDIEREIYENEGVMCKAIHMYIHPADPFEIHLFEIPLLRRIGYFQVSRLQLLSSGRELRVGMIRQMPHVPYCSCTVQADNLTLANSHGPLNSHDCPIHNSL